MSLQEPGIAEITSPTEGGALAGLIVIQGTADHPAFDHYELFFGYSPDETATWFPIGAFNLDPVRGAPLGVWDTTQITDGNYQLRLILRLDDGRAIEHIVSSLRVRNVRLIETDTPAPDEQPIAATPTFLRLTETPTAIAVSRGPQSGRLLDSFFQGALIAAIAMGGLGTYVWFRRSSLEGRTWPLSRLPGRRRR